MIDEYADPVPVPLPYPVNTAGAEDSAFIMPDGETLYVWFTPNVANPPEIQLTDGLTGIYVHHKKNDQWGPAERVILQDAGILDEFGETDKIFTNPNKRSTEDYITGRFG